MFVPIVVEAILLIPKNRIDLVGQQRRTQMEFFGILRFPKSNGNLFHRPKFPIDVTSQIYPLEAEFI